MWNVYVLARFESVNVVGFIECACRPPAWGEGHLDSEAFSFSVNPNYVSVEFRSDIISRQQEDEGVSLIFPGLEFRRLSNMQV